MSLDVDFITVQYDSKVGKYHSSLLVGFELEATTEKLIPGNQTEEVLQPHIEEELTPTETQRSLQDQIPFVVRSDINQDEYDSVPWSETRIPSIELFKGRNDLIEKLKRHYLSMNRRKSFVLYGLTRTGKSSILTYLAKEVELITLSLEGKQYKIIPFRWQLNEAAAQSSAGDMWNYLLEVNTLDKIKSLVQQKAIPSDAIPTTKKDLRFKDLREIIKFLKKAGYYPIFLIDEFTYYKELYSNKKLDASFLSVVREFAMQNLASFVFAGTYDLKALMKAPEYGITGQFANTIEEQIGRISNEASIELISVWQEKLSFSEPAILHILKLTNQVPYFIQVVCKNCGFYAIESNRWNLDFEDVEMVIKVLCGEMAAPENSMIIPLSAGIFSSNQYDPQDPKEIGAILSSICYFNRGKISPDGVSFQQIVELWSQFKVPAINFKVSSSIEKLLDKGILKYHGQSQDEYCISMDLFRRWWSLKHSNIELELNLLHENN